jgi:hypothetical protein
MSSGNPETKDPYIIQNTPVDYNANDWFYMNPKKCTLAADGKTYTDNKCNDNFEKAMRLKDVTNDLDASRTQYNDAKLLYNRELLFTVNMLAGLALLGYYIYLNQSVFPSPAKMMEGAKKATSSMTSMASSVASKIPMKPPVPK